MANKAWEYLTDYEKAKQLLEDLHREKLLYVAATTKAKAEVQKILDNNQTEGTGDGSLDEAKWNEIKDALTCHKFQVPVARYPEDESGPF